MRVTFLGVGAALPGPGQTNCAYLIDVPGACLLFDCGPAILQQLDAVGRSPGEVTHVFVSHAHGDHALGWPMFALWWGLVGKGTLPTVMCGAVTWNRLRGLWLHSYDDVPAATFPWMSVDGHGPFRINDDVQFTTFPLPHSTMYPVLAARFEVRDKVLGVTADSARSDRLAWVGANADLLIHDSRHAATVPPLSDIQHHFHTTAQDAGETAEKAGAKRLALVHIGAEYAGREAELVAEAKAKFGGEVFAPKGGDVVAVE
jgi:ribonuclease Z